MLFKKTEISFSGLSKSVIHNSDYQSLEDCTATIDRYFNLIEIATTALADFKKYCPNECGLLNDFCVASSYRPKVQ
jgi:hypothetical protein